MGNTELANRCSGNQGTRSSSYLPYSGPSASGRLGSGAAVGPREPDLLPAAPAVLGQPPTCGTTC